MAKADPIKRVNRAIQALQNMPDPIARLEAVRWVRERVEQLESATVRAARESGITWQDIGAVYGLTKQGAQQRFSVVATLQPGQTSADTSAHSRR